MSCTTRCKIIGGVANHMDTCSAVYTTATRWKQHFASGRGRRVSMGRKRYGAQWEEIRQLETSRCAVYISHGSLIVL